MIDANSQFFAILTNVGMAKQANADALGIPWKITDMGVGDANGTDPIPNAAQTTLIHEWRRRPLNQLKIDPNNPAVIIAEQIIPADEGGKWIREIGLYDADGDLVAVANCAPSFKPVLSQGSGRTQIVRMNFIVTSAGNITLKIDPAIVLASRAYVDAAILEVLPKNKTPGEWTRVKTNNLGIVVSGDNPDTLAGMGIKDTYTKPQVEAMIAQASALPVGTVVAFPKATVPPGFLELDGSVQSIATYPDLFAYLGTAFNTGGEGAGNFRLPESRGEFLRGWDHGRGVDIGRVVGSTQKGSLVALDTGTTGLQVMHFTGSPSVAGGQQAVGLDAYANADYQNLDIAGTTAQGTSALPGLASEVSSGVVRPRNLAVMWCIKAWNAPVNQGVIDVAALVVEMQNQKPMVPGMQIFSAPGISNFIVPQGTKADSIFEVEVWGGGGGGAGGSGGANGGGGGGGGGYSFKRLTGLVAGSTIKVTVGAGGTAGAWGAGGGAGGASSCDAYCSATGGGLGQLASGSSPGVSGGVGVGGELNLGGDPGKPCEAVVGGCGGMAPRGGGGGLGGYSAAGGAGLAPGGGGGGGDGPSFVGGPGAPGMVVIKWR
ncbi:phage tail protein [Pseudomonas sp. MM213]|uniref:phage tail protein n=1 Tax=Pseudomonas sp. MM213 TaxID=2866807 RepID=UPI001CF20FFC|nr:phage tail protein [Pseudomonas sp. MM213]